MRSLARIWMGTGGQVYRPVFWKLLRSAGRAKNRAAMLAAKLHASARTRAPVGREARAVGCIAVEVLDDALEDGVGQLGAMRGRRELAFVFPVGDERRLHQHR